MASCEQSAAHAQHPRYKGAKQLGIATESRNSGIDLSPNTRLSPLTNLKHTFDTPYTMADIAPPNPSGHPSSHADAERREEHLADDERQLAQSELTVPPVGIPLPGAIGSLHAPPPVTSTSTSTAPTLHATSSASSDDHPNLKGEDAQVAAQLASQKKESPFSTDLSEKHAASVSEKPKKRGFFARKKDKDAAAKKGKDKEDELNTLPPVSLFALFRFATKFEIMLDIIGLFLAAAAGATQPLMTLIFGRLTNSFTQFSIIAQEIAAEGINARTLQALSDAQAELRSDSGKNALYLVAIGLGMFVCTYLYMFIWNYTGELNAKRLREAYLRAVLRQEIAYFDDLGAGEVATRIQTDCHLVQEGTSE